MAKPSNNFFKLEMLLLKIINEHDCYGYQMTQILSTLTNNRINIKEGTMYPILYRLMDDGYISSKKVLVGKRLTRVYYHIEETGKEYLKQLYSEYKQTVHDIDNIMLWEEHKDE